MERRCPDDSCEKHQATSVDGDKTGLKLESSSIITTAAYENKTTVLLYEKKVSAIRFLKVLKL